MTAQRVMHLSLGQKGTELFPNGLDDVWWDRGHGHAPSRSGSLVTPRMIEHPVSAFHTGASQPYPRKLLVFENSVYAKFSIAPARSVGLAARDVHIVGYYVSYVQN